MFETVWGETEALTLFFKFLQKYRIYEVFGGGAIFFQAF